MTLADTSLFMPGRNKNKGDVEEQRTNCNFLLLEHLGVLSRPTVHPPLQKEVRSRCFCVLSLGSLGAGSKLLPPWQPYPVVLTDEEDEAAAVY